MMINSCILGKVFLLAIFIECQGVMEKDQILDECMKEIGISKDSTEAFKFPLNFNNPQIKCYHACTMKKHGFIENGVLMIEKARKFLAKELRYKTRDYAVELLSKELVYEVTNSDITDCGNEANEETNECEVAGGFYKCLFEKPRLLKKQ